MGQGRKHRHFTGKARALVPTQKELIGLFQTFLLPAHSHRDLLLYAVGSGPSDSVLAQSTPLNAPRKGPPSHFLTQVKQHLSTLARGSQANPFTVEFQHSAINSYVRSYSALREYQSAFKNSKNTAWALHLHSWDSSRCLVL